MLVIGLTGGIASGKSTVSGILREWGVKIIDADMVAREIVEPGTNTYKELVENFGREILYPDGTVNRKKLGQIVFNDFQKLNVLNKITHPPLLKEIKNRIEKIRESGTDAVLVLDAALLIEMEMTSWVDQVWLVVVDTETQIARVMERDKLTRDEALRRINAQMPLEQKLPYAHVIINNTRTTEEMRAQLQRIWQEKVVPYLENQTVK